MPPSRDIVRMRAGRQRLAALALALVLAAPAARAASGPAEAYYERTLMRAADARCHLFAPEISLALTAAEAQARGAALRGGASSQALRKVAAQAGARQAALPCASKDINIAAARVRTAFAGYARLIRMTFPGDDAAWQADRTLPERTPVWRLSQTTVAGGAPVVFGLAGDRRSPASLLAVADFGPGETPYAAQLMIRDVSRAPEPYLQAASVAAWARLPLSERAPPRSATLVFAAQARAPAAATLLPKGSDSAVAFRFPAAAAAALASLDPREAVSVEFLFQNAAGLSTRRAYIEIGDFAAAQAFLAAARR